MPIFLQRMPKLSDLQPKLSFFPSGSPVEKRMKFGEQLLLLAIPEWREFYLHYSNLKKILNSGGQLDAFDEKSKGPKSLRDDSSDTDSKFCKKPQQRAARAPLSSPSSNGSNTKQTTELHPRWTKTTVDTNAKIWYVDDAWLRMARTMPVMHQDFFNSLEFDIDRIEGHYRAHLVLYRGQLQKAQLKFYTRREANVGAAAATASVDFDALIQETQYLMHDLGLLKSFVEVNRTAIRKILKKHDKVTRTFTKQSILTRLAEKRSFFNAEALRRLIKDAVKCQGDVAKFTIKENLPVLVIALNNLLFLQNIAISSSATLTIADVSSYGSFTVFLQSLPVVLKQSTNLSLTL
eukprot:g32401.t1